MGVLSSALYKNPWRTIDWGDNASLKNVKNHKPSKDAVSHLRILLSGPVGAGKSAFINSMYTALRCKSANSAASNSMADRTKTFTVKYETYKFRKAGTEDQYCSFVICDTMGVEPGDDGVQTEDLKLVMEGHVKEGYKFNPQLIITEEHEGYIKNPTPSEKVHVLVCVISANTPDINPSVLQKMKDIREAARDLGIPQVAVVTNIDSLCEKVEDDVKNVYKSKVLKNEMSELSSKVGIPLNCMFPVKNYNDGNLEGNEDMDTLLLTALKHIVVYGDDFLDKL